MNTYFYWLVIIYLKLKCIKINDFELVDQAISKKKKLNQIGLNRYSMTKNDWDKIMKQHLYLHLQNYRLIKL